ncbi:MAG: hypothetical protein ACOCXQ_02110 [Patescibacteria group bacterium]
MKVLQQIDVGHPDVMRRMHKISRFTVIFPIVLFVFALGAHYYNDYRYEQQQNMMIQRQERQALIEARRDEALGLTSEGKTEQNTTIDLSSSYICSHQGETASSSAYIRDKKVFFSSEMASTSSYLLFVDDCLYTWEMADSITDSPNATGSAQLAPTGTLSLRDTKVSEGVKVCGLGEYLQMAELASSMGMLTTETILSSLSSYYEGPLASDEAHLRALGNSCTEQNVSGDPFVIPKDVVFIEKESSELTGGTSEGATDTNIGDIQDLLEGFIPQQ